MSRQIAASRLGQSLKRLGNRKDIPPYSGPKAARETHADLKQLSAIPGHIYTRPELQILPGQWRFSKMSWLVPMLELLPPASIGHLKEWGLSTVFVLAKNYNKLVHVWESVTAMVELWHPQTNSFIFPEFEATILLEELEIMLGLPRYQRGEESTISYTVEKINSWSILAYITTKKNDLYSMTSGMHVHLLPIAQWIISQCKQKTTNYTAIAKAAAICICGIILFPESYVAISFGNLSIIDSISEGRSLPKLQASQANLKHLNNRTANKELVLYTPNHTTSETTYKVTELATTKPIHNTLKL
ncbi:hypothetical protein Taro_018863 [Colocasia esculenta]|uniref:Aminotransferase-like plant mobile domain-containing protein n=1 Tax=Colocasia esculenta TaxID=4460 RepID=A0A843UJP6_COLES|nr:hypothetical protein [Colocasia esculenta]